MTLFGAITARNFYLQLTFPIAVSQLGGGFQAAGTILISIVGWQLWLAALREKSDARKGGEKTKKIGGSGGGAKKQVGK